MIRKWLEKYRLLQKFRKTPLYARFRQYLPMTDFKIIDDSNTIGGVQEVVMDWPLDLKKPVVGLIRDYEKFPRWTKYSRFLENNGIPYEYFDLHSNGWLDSAAHFDIIMGIVSCENFHLEEMRRKFFVLENYMNKVCYPSFKHIFLYENKIAVAWIAQVAEIPFVKTRIFYDREEALKAVENMEFPKVSKIDPSSGSMAVELVRNKDQARRIIHQSFSNVGRSTHKLYFRQKNYVYFQDFLENDGYDLRVILIDNTAFGYYRKVPAGDFRASGMNIIEFRALPEKAVLLTWEINQKIKSPMLVVDMLHGLDGKYYVIEISPVCLIDTPEQLVVNGISGAYVIQSDRTVRFVEGSYWVHELALKEFFFTEYFPKFAIDLSLSCC